MFDPFDDDDEDEALYENGRWEWSEATNGLVFESYLSVPEDECASPGPTAAAFGNIEFKDDIDIIEQHRFRKRFQRKSEGEDDVVFLQDVKDVVLYTSPSSLITPTVINILHAPSTERFIRALILYCQYYLQTSDEMSRRMLELETKIRTQRSAEIEQELKDDLEDLRLLVAKEYTTMLLGGSDYKKFHHMGPNKKSRSLSKKDIGIFESILRISIQMVWIALGRKSFNQIEIEINRIFKSQIFNMVEHKLNTDYVAKMMPYERQVLLGHCLQQGRKLNTRSPLVNEITCHHRSIDYRLIGLATMKFPSLSPRLRYLENSLSLSEQLFKEHGVILGILGLPRSGFDIMLREIQILSSKSTSTASFRARSVSRTSRSSVRKSAMVMKNLYEDIRLPSKEYEEDKLPDEFPRFTVKVRRCNSMQRLKWMARAARLTGKHYSVMRHFHNLRTH